MYRILTLFFLCSYLSSFSQENKFKFGLELTPNFSFATVYIKEPLHDSIEFLEEIFREEDVFKRKKPSLNAKVITEYALSQKTKIGIGLGFLNNGVRYAKLVFGIPITTESGNFTASNIKKATFLKIHYHIEVPLYLKFYINDKIYSQIGLSCSYNIYNKTVSKIFYTDQPERITTQRIKHSFAPFRKINLNGNVAFGIDFYNTDKITLFANPYAQYSLLGLYTNEVLLNRKMLSVGIGLGVKL